MTSRRTGRGLGWVWVAVLACTVACGFGGGAGRIDAGVLDAGSDMRSQARQEMADPRYTLDRIISGEFDGELRAWADGAKAFGTALIVQYGTEVNGDWNPWSALYNGGFEVGPAKFQKAFRHIVEVMRDEGANNITWALHLNGENWPGDTP